MQGGENLAQIDLLHAFSDNDEQKISKEVLSMVETFSDMRHLPNIKDSMHLLAEEFKKAGINKDDKTVDVSTAGTSMEAKELYFTASIFFSPLARPLETGSLTRTTRFPSPPSENVRKDCT